MNTYLDCVTAAAKALEPGGEEVELIARIAARKCPEELEAFAKISASTFTTAFEITLTDIRVSIQDRSCETDSSQEHHRISRRAASRRVALMPPSCLSSIQFPLSGEDLGEGRQNVE